jgi:predicted Zn finger-like uncharacterized protein
MYSQCPDCQTRFRVTADALRAARGTVRCGRCGSAFDALERLSDSIPPRTADVPAALGAGAGLSAGAVDARDEAIRFTAADLERVFVDSRDWQAQFGAPAGATADGFDPVATGGDALQVVVDEDSRFEDITLEGERIRIEAPPEAGAPEVDLGSSDQFEILRDLPESAYPRDDDAEFEELVQQITGEFDRPVAAPDPPPVAAAARAVPAPAPVPAEARPSTVEASLGMQRWRTAPPVPDADLVLDRDAGTPAGSRWRTFAWSAGSLLLLVALAGQAIHHYRQDLVRHPQLGAPLRAAYARLDLPLMPNWDLAAFELRQWSSEAGATDDGRMVVRASLTNRAAFAQPHPVLRLELDDRYGASVATRDFEPADYLKDPLQAPRLLAPGATSEAELILADPGTEAVGYRLDVCLRESAALLRCASGPG